jgi:hypothetical protein
MSIKLTEEQRQSLADSPPPCRVIDPATKEAYVLIRAEVYERHRDLLEDDYNPREAYPYVDKVMAEDDARDPTLESYQHIERDQRP